MKEFELSTKSHVVQQLLDGITSAEEPADRLLQMAAGTRCAMDAIADFCTLIGETEAGDGVRLARDQFLGALEVLGRPDSEPPPSSDGVATLIQRCARFSAHHEDAEHRAEFYGVPRAMAYTPITSMPTCPRPCHDCPDGDHHFSIEYADFLEIGGEMQSLVCCKHCNAARLYDPDGEDAEA